MDQKSKLALARVAIFILGFLFLSSLEEQARPYVIDGYRFQEWSSEGMMQTVSLEDLRNAPIESLINIHIQPPGLDVLRAMLVRLWPALDIQTALRQVDLSLYFLWAILYCLSGVIIFQWLSGLIDPKVAFAAALLFLLHPAAILYSTLLDTTFISAFLVLWMYYSLWQLRRNPSPIFAVTASSVLLFFFRSIFQLPFVLLMGASLYLLKVPRHKVALFLIISGGICGLYIAKQYYQFGLITTSSLNGINLVRSVGITKYSRPYTINLDGLLPASLPEVLTRKTKLDGSINYNNLHYLDFNQQLTDEYKQYLFTTPPQTILHSYVQNLLFYFAPSSLYTIDIIVERLPWRSIYDTIFSGPVLSILLCLAAAIWIAKTLREKNYDYRLAILLPALYIFSISVLFEQGENNRFKFFLEPVFYVFMVSQFYGSIRQSYRKVSRIYLRK
jgi:hypothetical protein